MNQIINSLALFPTHDCEPKVNLAVSLYLCHLKSSSCGIFRKPCSESKMKEITGSGIFVANGEDDTAEDGSVNPQNKTGIRMYQVLFFTI